MDTTGAGEWDVRNRMAPLILIGLGIGLVLTQSIVRPGKMGVTLDFAFNMAMIIIGAGIALIACYATASVFSISFGLLGPAVRKLLAVYAFTSGVSPFLPPLGCLTLAFILLLYGSLMGLLFDIEWWEVACFVFVLIGVHIGMVFMGTWMAAAG